MENVTFEKLPSAVAGLYEKLERLERIILDLGKKDDKPKAQLELADEYICRKQAAKLLKISLPTLSEWSKSGIVKGYRIATRVRYKRRELELAVKAMKV
jgi:hypothetical protein